MKGIEHLNDKIISSVADRVYTTSSSLKGLASILTQTSRETCLKQSEFCGIGHLMEKMGEELEVLEDILRCGKDSTVNERYGLVISTEE